MNEYYNEFILWLKGIVEDDPIPYEIKSLVFYLNKNNEIGFSGTEEKEVKVVDKFFYYPLEAQYFYCSNLYNKLFKLTNNEKLNVLKNLLVNLSDDGYFKKFNLYYGFLYNNAKKIKK